MSLGPEQIINAIWANSSENIFQMSSSGKSGALFYYTKDRKYMLKSISAREFKELIRILEDYLKHFTEHPESLLVKFFGAYRLKWKNPNQKNCMCQHPETVSHIVVMANVFEHFQVGYRYDLKGSKKSRDRLAKGQQEKEKEYKTHKESISLKCNDFRILERDLLLSESLSSFKTQLAQVFENDAAFLARNMLMDYSLLAGIVNKKPEEVR